MKEYWIEVHFSNKPTISHAQVAEDGLQAITKTAEHLTIQGETDVLQLSIYYIKEHANPAEPFRI